MSVLPVCHLRVCCPRRSEEYVRSSELGVVSQNVGAGNRTWVFWKGSQCSNSNSGVISPVFWQYSWLMLLKHIRNRKSRLMKWRSAFFSCLPYCRLIKQKTVFLDSDGLGLNLCLDSVYVAQTDLESMILLPQSPECWEYMYVYLEFCSISLTLFSLLENKNWKNNFVPPVLLKAFDGF